MIADEGEKHHGHYLYGCKQILQAKAAPVGHQVFSVVHVSLVNTSTVIYFYRDIPLREANVLLLTVERAIRFSGPENWKLPH